MTIEYLRGTDNKVADALSRVETRLDPDTVKALLDHARDGLPRAESEDLRVVEDECHADEGSYPTGNPTGPPGEEVQEPTH